MLTGQNVIGMTLTPSRCVPMYIAWHTSGLCLPNLMVASSARIFFEVMLRVFQTSSFSSWFLLEQRPEVVCWCTLSYPVVIFGFS